MVVQHNLQAMNSSRMLGITQGTLSKSTEKLSSGYKINRAADNAAGLSISEKMRKQIRGLDQASTNAEDGISAVQTAEGALQEVTDMLQRMNELAVQSANGTNSATDRQYIQNEIDQLVTEIDRVAETTKFNETYLLKGDENGVGKTKYTQSYATTYTVNLGSNKGVVANKYNYTGKSALVVVSGTIDATAKTSKWAAASAEVLEYGDDITKYIGVDADKDDFKTPASVTTAQVNTATYTAFELMAAEDVTDSLEVDAISGDITVADGAQLYVLDKSNNQVISLADGDDVSKYIKNVQVDADSTGVSYMQAADGYAFLKEVDTANAEVSVKVDKSAAQLYDGAGNAVSGVALQNYYNAFGVYIDGSLFADAEGKTAVTADDIDSYVNKTLTHVTDNLSFSLHVGADSASTNKITTSIQSMSAASLGIDVLKSTQAGMVDATGAKATDAIDVIANALQQVSTQRSALGAIQNRLEHTIKNLDNVVENTTAAESQIRDTDMADEMVKYSNANILAQAGQSMLAQSNQANQGVLSILG